MLTRMLTIVLLTGCGVEQQNAAPQPQTTEESGPVSLAVTSMAALPPCDADRDRQLVYLMNEQEFRTCQSGIWQVVVIQGAAGPEGPAGKRGPAGEAGAAGKDGADGVAGKDGEAGEDAQVVVDTITTQGAILAFQTIHADDAVEDLSAAVLAILADKDTTVSDNPNHCPGLATQEYDREQDGYTFFVRIFKSVVRQVSVLKDGADIHYENAIYTCS